MKIFVLLVLTTLIVSLVLRIDTIACSIATDELCQNIEELAELKNTPIFFTDFSLHPSLISYAKNNTLELKSYSIKVPKTLILQFEKIPIAYTIAVNDTTYFAVTQAGTLKQLTSSPEKTKLQITTEVALLEENQNIQPKLHVFFSEYILAQTTNTVLPEKLIVQNSHIELRTKNGIQILLPFERAQDKLRQLDEILRSQAVLALSEPVIEIDLRFDLPVLRTKR